MKNFFLFPLLLILLSACQKDILTTINSPSNDKISYEEVGLPYAVIGEKQDNPLEINNVISAFNQLPASTKDGVNAADINPTHKYIAFTPSNDDEYYALDDIDEDEVTLSAYPLDYDVTDGLIVPDERFVKNGYSYRWAYVPVDYDLSTIQCPYIYYYDIFSPTENASTKSGASFSSDFLDALEQKSYEICGIELKPMAVTKASKVTPYGRFRFYDIDSLKYRGVDGLSIRTVRGTHSSYTHCDASGNFTSNDSFRYAFRYEIHFSRTDFVIRKNSTNDEIIIKYSGYTGPIYKDLNDAETSFYATVSRAAIVYYYGDNCGLRRPPMKSDKTARLAIQAQLTYNPDAYGYFSVNNRWIFSDRPVLNIYRDEPGSRRDNIDIYATTMHELSHASHWRNNKSRFNDTDNVVIESFARGVQWILTNNAYPGYSVPFYYRQSYSGVVQDLIDGYGTKHSKAYAIWVDGELVYHRSYKSYYDHVTGFTPTQIEEAVRKSKTWDEWLNNIINDYPSVASSTDITAAFSYWNSAN